jgi:hypothetical protein
MKKVLWMLNYLTLVKASVSIRGPFITKRYSSIMAIANLTSIYINHLFLAWIAIRSRVKHQV